MRAPTPLCPRIKLGDLNVASEALPMFPPSPINPPTAPTGGSVTPEQAPWLFSPSYRAATQTLGPSSNVLPPRRHQWRPLCAQVTCCLPQAWTP